MRRFVPRLCAPVHGVNFGEMAPEGPPGPHLDPADGFHRPSGLSQGGVAGRLATILHTVTTL